MLANKQTSKRQSILKAVLIGKWNLPPGSMNKLSFGSFTWYDKLSSSFETKPVPLSLKSSSSHSSSSSAPSAPSAIDVKYFDRAEDGVKNNGAARLAVARITLVLAVGWRRELVGCLLLRWWTVKDLFSIFEVRSKMDDCEEEGEHTVDFVKTLLVDAVESEAPGSLRMIFAAKYIDKN